VWESFACRRCDNLRAAGEVAIDRQSSGTDRLSDEVIGNIIAALPPGSMPEGVALLPEILRAWADEDLRGHLSLEGRVAKRQREKRLRSVGARAQELIKAIEALDHTGFFDTALEPQMRRAGTSLLKTDITAAKQRRDSAISWLVDLAEVFNGSEYESANGKKLKPPPDKATRYYLLMLDLAAIFELVSGEEAKRRVDFDSGRTYGPFADFAAGAWLGVFGNIRGLSYAIRVWADEMTRLRKLAEAAVSEATSLTSRELSDAERDAIENRYGAYSSFVANIQFRHPDLWRRIRRMPR
jgi:hypothetical protein